MKPFVGNNWELLAEVGDWSLQRSIGSEDHVGICHSKSHASWMMVTAKYAGVCTDCEEPIPQDVMGLWILYNFDKYTDI